MMRGPKMAEYKKKLIEVALPLDDINAACQREKSIRHGHPSTLHLWWARRPLAAARAVTWASLVDDPSSHPEEFPTEEEQNAERERLFSILRDLVIWENSNNQELLERAKAEIMKSTNNNPPAFLDPFAGGGALPFEAQRLGLKTYSSDLNPVSVMLNKAMIDFPSRFQNVKPINPNSSQEQYQWYASAGLADDVEFYGNLLKNKAYEKLSSYYPRFKHISNGKEIDSTVIAWLWARTIKCPNPACEADVPLIHSFNIYTKKGKEKHIEPYYDSQKKLRFKIKDGLSKKASEGTVTRQGVTCPCCNEPFDFDYIRSKARREGFNTELMGIVCENQNKGHSYYDASYVKCNCKDVPNDFDYPHAQMPEEALGFRTQIYGMTDFSSLFTRRQLFMLTTFSNLIEDVRKQIEYDALKSGMKEDNIHIKDGGMGALAYSEAISIYLSFVIDKLTDYHSSNCTWIATLGAIRNVFGRQAIPMVWDFAEANPFCSSAGCFDNMLEWVKKAIQNFPSMNQNGTVIQWDATQDNGLRDIMVSTDPPYYDNIGYSDLSDFFYIWMKNSIGYIFPDIFSTLVTPKSAELIATPFRFDGSKLKAREFFEDGMSQTCLNLYKYSRNDIPVTIYYAFKQNDSEDDGDASSGWETMLSAIIKSGFEITGTWPMRTERGVRPVASESNALASSVVIVCKKTTEKKQDIDLRSFLNILKNEMTPALKKLQASSIAPVDLPQSAIGPGIAVYSRYNSIIQNDGSTLSVRDALKIINRELDQYLNDVNFSMDSETSLALAMYKQKAFDEWQFGEVNNIANAKGIAVDRLEHLGIINSGKGKVSLKERSELNVKDNHDCLWLTTQLTVKAYETKGLEGVAEIFLDISQNTQTQIKALCYQLFLLADRNGWTSEALAYNDLISSWDESVSTMIAVKARKKEYVQYNLFDNEEV